MEEIENICCLCNNHIALYTCPKCGVKYCSVACYQRKEHATCSEEFYKSEVMKNLREMHIEDNEDKKKVMNMLRKIEDEHLVRVDDVAIDEMWGELDEDEKNEFLDSVKNESIGAFLKPWIPWWRRTRSSLIVDDESKNVDMPKIWKPTYFSITKTTNNFICDILNVIFSYVYVVHRHNGDIFDLLLESSSEILALSSTLCGHNFKDISTAVVDVIFKLNTRPDMCLYVSEEFTILVLEEVCDLINGGNFLNLNEFILAALSECRSVFKQCNKRNKNERPTDKSFFLAQKKIEFFISWIFEVHPNFGGVASILKIEISDQKRQLLDKKKFDLSGYNKTHASSIIKEIL